MSIVTLDNGVFVDAVMNCDTCLGGEDFDQRVRQYFLVSQKRHGEGMLALARHFEPFWLASAGLDEAPFQVYSYLKECSMAENAQPDVGAKRCHDVLRDGPERSPHERFIVRKAEVWRSGANVLTPFVNMVPRPASRSQARPGQIIRWSGMLRCPRTTLISQ